MAKRTAEVLPFRATQDQPQAQSGNKGMLPYYPISTYLTNFLAPYFLRSAELNGIASIFPQWSAGAALALDALEYIPLVGRFANLGLGVISLINGFHAYNDFKTAHDILDYAQPLLEGWMALQTGQDALVYRAGKK